MKIDVALALRRLASLRKNDHGNSHVDAIVMLLKMKVPFVVTCHQGDVEISSWLVGVSLRAVLRRGGVAFAFNGPCVRESEEAVRPKVFCESVLALSRRFKISKVEVRSYALNRTTEQDLAMMPADCAVSIEVFSTFTNTLGDVATLVQRLPSDRRRLHKVGSEEGLVVRDFVSPRHMIALASSAYARRGDRFSALSKARLALFWMLARASSVVKIFGTYLDGAIQAYAIVQIARNRGLYLYGGSVEKPHRAAGAFLQAEIMVRLGKDGVQQYDFGGATFEHAAGVAIARFKKNFGGLETRHANVTIQLGSV